MDGGVGKTRGLEDPGGLAEVVVAEFQEEVVNGSGQGGGEAAEGIEAVGAAAEGDGGIMADFGGEGGDFGIGEVGEVGDNGVGSKGTEEVGFKKFDADGGGVGGLVAAGEGQGIGGNLGGGDAPGGQGGGEGEGDGTGAGADVGEVAGGKGTQGLDGQLDEHFGFGAGDEGLGAAGEGEAEEAGVAEDVLEGFALGAAFDQGAEGIEFGGGEDAFELEVELHPGEVEDVGEEGFDLEAGGGDALAGEVVGGAVDQVEEFQGGRW